MPGDSVEITPLQAQWSDPSTQNEKEMLEAAQMKSALGVPDAEIFSELGYDQAQIERFITEKQRRQEERDNIGAKLLKSFETGATE